MGRRPKHDGEPLYTIGYDGQPLTHEQTEKVKGYVKEIERVEDQISADREDVKQMYAAAKADGFDVKALRAEIVRRKKVREDMDRQQRTQEAYRTAIESFETTPLGASVRPRTEVQHLVVAP